jgi:hypothetical protein
MIKKILISLLISALLIEIILRVFYKLPDLDVYSYNATTDILLFKPNLNANISTRRALNLNRTIAINELPPTIHIITDQNGFRRSELDHSKSQHLVLGDSITLGWPVDFKYSAIATAENQLQLPIAPCAFMAMGPVQHLKVLERGHCKYSNLKTVVIQITVHDSFKFPDTLFIDNFGDGYQSHLIYAINNPQKDVHYAPDAQEKAIIQKFNNDYFNDYLKLIDSTYLTKIIFFLNINSRNQAFHKFEELAQTNVSKNLRHEKTLAAIDAIALKLSIKPLILINRTKTAIIQTTPRPEVELLITALKQKKYVVADMMEENDLTRMPEQFYYTNDFHPNAEGHRLIGKKLAVLLKKE